MSLKDRVWKALGKVIDPEVGHSVVDMGLVYRVNIKKLKPRNLKASQKPQSQKNKNYLVEVEMTLTSPGCPLAGMLEQMVREELGKVKRIKKVKLVLVWEPVWTPAMMSKQIKAEMGYD